MTAVAVTAKLFSQRPSALLAIKDPVLALAIDLEGAQRLAELKMDAEREGDSFSGPAKRIYL